MNPNNVDLSALFDDAGNPKNAGPDGLSEIMIRRNPDGSVKSIEPFGAAQEEEALDAAGQLRDLKIARGDPALMLKPLPTSEQELLIDIIATRMFAWYEQRLEDKMLTNPLRDGIVTCPDHPLACWNPRKRCNVTRKYATRGEVHDWLKCWVAQAASQHYIRKRRS